MTKPVLPSELWWLIFQYVADDEEDQEGPHPIFPIQLVCKSWKNLSTSLLYRRIAFVKASSLAAFLLHLEQCKASGFYPGSHVRALKIDQSLGRNANKISSVLQHLPNLASLSGPRLYQSDLDMLVSTCRKTVQDVHITMNGGWGGTMDALSKLETMRRLRLDFNEEWKVVFNPSQNKPLCLPSLESLELRVAQCMGLGDHLKFFITCRFDNLRRLSLPFMNRWPRSDVIRFLTHFGPQLDWFELDDELNRWFLTDPPTNPPFANLRRISWGSTYCPSSTQLPLIPSTVRHIHFYHAYAVVAYVGFFDGMISGDCPAPIQTIQLEAQFFVWTRLDGRTPRYAEEWRDIAVKLRGRGIALLDTHGREYEV